MKKCCFIIPYFGKFNNYFPLFLKTCAWNTDFNWLVITDDETPYDYPNNFRVIKMSFDKLKELVQSKFDFPISLEKPYKLCDYKPAYGYIFEEYLSGYKFWGHCDTDVLMGNLNTFFTDELFSKYDKIGCLGHMILYRNTEDNNRVFMHDYRGISLFQKAFSTPGIVTFDEEYLYDNNINRIYLAEHRPVLIKDMSFNFHMSYYQFVRVQYTGRYTSLSPHGYVAEKYRDAVYLWKKGHIKRYMLVNNELNIEEAAYIHLQKRTMEFIRELLNVEVVKVIPNKFDFLEVKEITSGNFSNIIKWDSNLELFKSFILRSLKSIKNSLWIR